MATVESSASALHPHRDELDERGHECRACYDGWVYIGHMVEDPATGEEVEVVESIECRRCSRSGRA